MASAASPSPQEQIVTMTKRIEYNTVKINEAEPRVKNILKGWLVDPLNPKEGFIDETNRDKKEIAEHGKLKAEIKRLKADIDRDTGRLPLLQKMVEKMQTASSATASSASKAAPGASAAPSAKGGKRRKTTTRKQKGRRTTKKQNKNKKSRKQ